jgi:MFS family permease
MTTAFVPPLFAITQSLVAPSMRALTSALLVMASSLLGGAFGPSVTGSLSDLINIVFGTGLESIRSAILVAFAFSIGGAWFFLKAGKELQPVPLKEYGSQTE